MGEMYHSLTTVHDNSNENRVSVTVGTLNTIGTIETIGPRSTSTYKLNLFPLLLVCFLPPRNHSSHFFTLSNLSSISQAPFHLTSPEQASFQRINSSLSSFTNGANGSMNSPSSPDSNNDYYSQAVANGTAQSKTGGMAAGFSYPLSESTALSNLTPTAAAISTKPQRQYVRYLTCQDNYLFVTMRFGAVCAALTRFDMDRAAVNIGQFATNFLGREMFFTALEHYLGEQALGDDVVSIKYCLIDLIEDIEVYLDAKMGSGFGADLRKVVKECGLVYDPSEVPAEVEMSEVVVEKMGMGDYDDEGDDLYED